MTCELIRYSTAPTIPAAALNYGEIAMVVEKHYACGVCAVPPDKEFCIRGADFIVYLDGSGWDELRCIHVKRLPKGTELKITT